MTPPLRIFLGWDSREPLAWHVAAHSILTRASVPVAIVPLAQPALRAAGLYWRARGPTESTEFSLTRFLIPALCEYRGFAVFMDCDVLVRVDIAELVRHVEEDPWRAVWVVQHDYVPRTATKMGGQLQTAYSRKNWSSVMVLNAERCRRLTPVYVNVASGLELHRFAWLRDEEIGALPMAWNWLVGEYPPNPVAKIIHYTLGGPWLPEHEACDHAAEWRAELLGAVGTLSETLP